jgi:sugar lactone lactonase YvrE
MQSYDPATGRHEYFALPADLMVGSYAFRESGGFIMATSRGFWAYQPGSELEFLLNPESEKPENRLNDGKCDRAGRFWCGSMLETRREPLGTLYRLNSDMSCAAIFDDIVIPNSISWSPDNRTMYFADTTRQLIFEFDFDLDDGTVSNRRLFKDLTGQPGHPDGSTVDQDGCIWNAEYGGSRVVRYSPQGAVLDEIKLPVTQVTCCTFGGTDLDTLYITSAAQNLSEEQLATQTHAGALFAIKVTTRGIPESRFLG